jgi:S-adenosylmethionine synthetase
MVDLDGSGIVDEERLRAGLRKIFKLTPGGIIETLNLRRPIYKKTAAYGHFGSEMSEFTWNKKDKVAELRIYFGSLLSKIT